MAGKRPRIVTSPHSKNACRTCRIRKVKCDETIPECKRCTSTGRKCDGYPARSSSEERRLVRVLLPSSQSPPSPCSPSSPLSINFTTSNYERTAFNFFIRDTAWILRSVIQSDGWVELALQLSLEQPAVFQAVAAVGGIHNKLHHEFHHTLVRPEPGVYQADAMQQYCRATVNLRKYLESAGQDRNTTIEPVLLCCMLLACFEVYQGRGAVGLSHLRLGRRIANSFQNSSNNGVAKMEVRSPKVSRQLLSAFDHLQATSSTLEPADIRLCSPEDDTTSALDRQLQIAFACLEDAKISLQNLLTQSEKWKDDLLRVAESRMSMETLPEMTRGTRYCIAHCVSRTVSIGQKQSQQRHDLMRAHDIWSRRLADFVHRHGRPDCQVISLMRVKVAFSKFLLKTARTTTECSMDETDLDDLLDLLDQYIAGSDAPARPIASPRDYRDPLRTAQRDLKLELTILPALSVCCLKSRSPDRRQRALSLISGLERREGIAWSPMLALYVQTIADLEEQAARKLQTIKSEDEKLSIPEAARFLDVVVDVPGGEVQLRLVHGRYRHEDDGALDITILEGYGPPPFMMNVVEKFSFPSLAIGNI